MKYVALGDVTIHKLLTPETGTFKDPSTNNAPCISVTLVAGDSLPEDLVPYYVKEAYDAGKIPLLSLVSDANAKKMAKEADEERVKDEQTLAPPAIQTPGNEASSGPGRVADTSGSDVVEIEGETVFISGSNAGYGAEAEPQTEVIQA